MPYYSNLTNVENNARRIHVGWSIKVLWIGIGIVCIGGAVALSMIGIPAPLQDIHKSISIDHLLGPKK
jgi:hypothetical protein